MDEVEKLVNDINEIVEKDKKEITGIINIRLIGGKATPGGNRLGSYLSPRKIDLNSFCKAFNEKTNQLGLTGIKLTVEVITYTKNNYDFNIVGEPFKSTFSRILGIEKLNNNTVISELDYQKVFNEFFRIRNILDENLDKENCDKEVRKSLLSMRISIK